MTDGAPQGREYELKFAIDPGACAALVSHPLLVDLAGESRALSSTYFDTPDDRLRRAHVSLRLRTGGSGGTMQTLKQAAGGSIVDRAEWEQPVSGARPDTALLGGTSLKPLLDEVDSALVPRFTVEVTRATFPLRRGAVEIEAALDRGTIRAENGALAISELELESKRGRCDAVFAVARDLVRDLPLILSLESKSERGFAVADHSVGKPIKTLALELTPAMTRAAAFEAVVQGCLVALTHNSALIRGDQDGDGEAVHKTRIALRRLRAALALFAPSLRRRRLVALASDLKWAAAKLGDARDADVLREIYVDPAARAARIDGAGALAALMAGQRTRAHENLRAALASPRWRLLLVELLAFSIDGVRRAQRERGWRVFVRRRLAAHRCALAKSTRRFGRLSPDALHDVRKDAKMLRYDLEMLTPVQGLGGGRRVARLVGALETLQDTLGILQDETAARKKLREVVVASRRPPGLSRDAWRTAAEKIVPQAADDGQLMRRAAKAARRLERPVAFR